MAIQGSLTEALHEIVGALLSPQRCCPRANREAESMSGRIVSERVPPARTHFHNRMEVWGYPAPPKSSSGSGNAPKLTGPTTKLLQKVDFPYPNGSNGMLLAWENSGVEKSGAYPDRMPSVPTFGSSLLSPLSLGNLSNPG